uniref:Ubiquitin-like domain-containing protein n=1 Tax=Picocystis salinarum TaxID=88271 RepID=A0A7S3UCS0_9CHLO|mmetsp:Transcript_6306/g.39281  ORF Transcript_6306/g.39281 Transcript_6306/m.39281 type:complete len:495 (+) Transcript_6306:260-1744(+)
MDDGVNAYFGAGRQEEPLSSGANGRGTTRNAYPTDVSHDVEELVQHARRALTTAEKQLEYVEADESEQLKVLAQAEKRYNVANKNVHDCYNRLQDARREVHASLEMLESVKDSLTRAELRKMEATREKDRCIFMLDSARKMGVAQNTVPAPTAPAPQRDSVPAYPARHQPYSSNAQQQYSGNVQQPYSSAAQQPYSQHSNQPGVHFQDAPEDRQVYGSGAGRRNISATLASRLASVRSKSNMQEEPRANNPYAPKSSRDYEQAYYPPPPAAPSLSKPEEEAPVELKDSTRSKLEQTMEPFMPRAHYLKKHLSALPGIREKIPRPGFICNRTCDMTCLCQSATGFLAMADIEILQENAPSDMLIAALTKARRKYHPDKNRIEVVGEEEFHHAEEMCKIASSLVNLFKEAENINIIAHLLPQDLKLKFQMSMKDTIETIKHRIEEEESIPQGSLLISLGQHPLADHMTLSQCNIMEMAVVTVTSNRAVQESRRSQF